ncbi:MAG: hypothetical protein ACHQHN_00820 [Sphingobacteriales bacterium]
MTKLTVSIPDNNDVPFLQEMLERIGLSYEIVSDEKDYLFSPDEIKGFVQTRKDYLDGKTTARDWIDVEKDLNRAFD